MSEIQITSTEKANIVKISGRLDIAGVQKIELEFAGIGNKNENIIVDLSGVEFCASFGMRMLLSTAKKLDAAGKKLLLTGPNESVLVTLETAGMTTIMPVYQDETDALSNL
tara:strand:+ start:362 stop:694 length:333 start_codon:yes stop_codon:yes gene_type:complete